MGVHLFETGFDGGVFAGDERREDHGDENAILPTRLEDLEQLGSGVRHVLALATVVRSGVDDDEVGLVSGHGGFGTRLDRGDGVRADGRRGFDLVVVQRAGGGAAHVVDGVSVGD